MEIKVKKIQSTKEIKKFIEFPNQLYKENKFFVPAIKKNELKTFDASRNPALKFCESQLWLAYKNNVIVGRVAGIINYKYNEKTNTKYARFGWLDFENDINILNALINEVETWAKEKKMNLLHGPLGFTSFDASGVLVEGFEEMATSFGHYNYPYYDKFIKEIGFKKEIDWVEFRINVPKILPEKVFKLAHIIKDRYKIKEIELNDKKDLLKYIDDFFEILNNAYSNLFAFNELIEEQKKQITEEFLSLLKLDYISFLADENDNLVAFGISSPSMAKAIQKSKGQLYPIGWLRILKALNKNDTAELLLIGIKKNYQNKGLTAIIFSKIMKTFADNGIKYVETTRELEENNNIQQLWSKYEYRQHKRARCYIKTI